MNDYKLHITRHAHKRYRQRVGNVRHGLLYQRCQTALQIGHYRYGRGVIKMYGVWWGCIVKGRELILTTCYGKLDYDLIQHRSKMAR